MTDFFHSLFNTDWAAFSARNWVGIIIVVVIFFIMVGVYFYVFLPKNRDRLESYRDLALRDEDDKKDE